MRRYGFYYCYDTAQERETLAELWKLVARKMNYFTATRKPTGWETDGVGRRKRIYDKPQTTLSRLLQAEILSPEQVRKLIERRDSINPAELTRNINRLQCLLTGLAKSKTDLLIEETEEAKRLRLNRQQGDVRVVAQHG